MSTFKVTDIIDANTIKVNPSWSFVNSSGEEISDDKIKIFGLDVPANDEFTKHILSILLKGRDVQLVNPIISGLENGHQSEIACKVIIDKSDITYYFSKISPKTNKEFA